MTRLIDSDVSIMEFKIGRAIDVAPSEYARPYSVVDRNRDANGMIGSASNEDIMLPGI